MAGKHKGNAIPNHESEDFFARELEKVQEQVTGKGGHAGSESDIDAKGSDSELGSKLESAKKVMELLARMRPDSVSIGQNDTIGIRDTIDSMGLGELTRPDTEVDDLDFLVEEDPARTLPSKIGKFQVKRLLGQGGFGLVFLAEDAELDRLVALKIPSFRALLDDESHARFKREARAVASLNHPNIVPVFEVGKEGSISFIASEFISGCDLAEWVSSRGRLDQRDAAKATAVISDAIQHAHRRGVVHRDLKPGNILVETTDSHSPFDASALRVTDFGLAKMLVDSDTERHTRTGSVIGTPAFTAPEQIQPVAGNHSVESADIYSLGALLYYLLTGKAPFQAANLSEMVKKVVHESPVSPEKNCPGLSSDLAAICLKCLAKDPRHRYPSAHELNLDLNRFLNGEVTLARPTTLATRVIRWTKRNPIPTAMLAFVAASAMIVSFLLIREGNLRQLAESREQQVVQSSRQLHQAIDRLFLTVANTPELKLKDFEEFRQKLLSEASSLVTQFVDDKPDDLELFELYAETQLGFVKLSDALDEGDLARETANELASDINARLELIEEGPIRNRLLVTLTEAELVLVDRDREPDHRLVRMDRILERVNGELSEYENDETKIARASALSQIAARMIFDSGYTEATKIQQMAQEIYSEIPNDQLVEPNRLEEFARCYFHSIKVIASSEDPQAAIPVAERAIEVLESQLQNQLSPQCQFFLADIYRNYGFVIQREDRNEGIRLTERGHQIALELAEAHPAIPAYQAHLADSNYTRALLPYFAHDYDKAVSILLQNIELTNELRVKFTSHAFRARLKQSQANSLTLLGLIHGRRRNWQQQLETLQQSLELINQNVQSTKSLALKVQASGLINEIGLCHARLGNTKAGAEMALQSVRELEEYWADDPASGQARRFLVGSLRNAAEALRRDKNFKQAEKSFDRFTELNGSSDESVKPAHMTSHIAIVVGLKEYDRASKLLDEYSPFVLEQKLEAHNVHVRLDQSEHLAEAVLALDDSTERESELVKQLRTKLVGFSFQLLSQYIDSSDDRSTAIMGINDRKDLTILLSENELAQLVESR